MFGLGESTSRLGESSSSVRTGHRRLLLSLRRCYLRSGVGRSGAAMRVLSRPRRLMLVTACNHGMSDELC
jgi:hypothetical protein